MDNTDLINQISKERNHTENTKKRFLLIGQLYSEYHNLSLKELLDEADEEEEQGIRWKKRTLRKRLIDFREHVHSQVLASTASMYFQNVLSIYRHFEIEIHDLPFFSDKNLKQNPPVTFKDIPNKKVLTQAIRASDNRMRAIILFSSSSGCAMKETLSVTVGDFVEATREYHSNGEDIYQILKEIQSHDNIIPTFTLRRHKTNKHYYTFCSPEAVEAIIIYLKGRKKELKLDSPIFDIGQSRLHQKYQELNDKLGLGHRGNRRILTSHAVRKYHSTTLNNLNIFTESEVHFLQGRARGTLDEIYLMKDPDKLKEKYMECLKDLQVNWDYKLVTAESPKVQKVIQENNELKEGLYYNSKRLDKVEEIVNSKTEEEWREILDGIDDELIDKMDSER